MLFQRHKFKNFQKGLSRRDRILYLGENWPFGSFAPPLHKESLKNAYAVYAATLPTSKVNFIPNHVGKLLSYVYMASKIC